MNYWTIAKWMGGIVLGLGVAWSIYAGIIRPTTKPNPTTTQNAEKIVNYTLSPRVSFGCVNWRIIREKQDKVITNSTI